MKVAHLSSYLCRSSAGLGVAVAGISLHAMRAGDDAQVFGLSSKNWVSGDCQTWTGASPRVFDPASISGAFGFAPGMLEAVLEFDPDIVHLHGLWTYPAVVAHQWQRKTLRPLVVSAHGMLAPVALGDKRWRKALARLLYQDKILGAAKVLHSTSSDESTSYRLLGLNNRIALIPLGLTFVERPLPVGARARRRVLFLGRLHSIKGVDWLIEAWAKIEREFLDWDLCIAGPTDPIYAREMARLKDSSTGKRVFFLGPLYGADKLKVVCESDLFAMPSRSENFGLTAAEALMLEVPVIATRATPWSGLVEHDAGWWIDLGAAALEEALRAAMRLSPPELHQKGLNGRHWIQRDFSWQVVGQKWQLLYQCLLSDAGFMNLACRDLTTQ